jgi:hypothetical protein
MGNEIQAYGEWSVEAAVELQKASKAMSKTSMVTKLPEGKTVLRVGPPRPGKTSPIILVPEHFLELPDGNKTSFPCPRMVSGGTMSCPCCKRAFQMQANGNAIDSKRAEKLLPSPRYYAAALFRASEANGFTVWKFGVMIYNELMALRDPEVGGNFTHPTHGFDVVVIRTGTGQNDTRYKASKHASGNTPIVSDAVKMNELLKALPNIEQYLYAPTENDIKAVMSGQIKFIDASNYAPARKQDSDGALHGTVVDDSGDDL